MMTRRFTPAVCCAACCLLAGRSPGDARITISLGVANRLGDGVLTLDNVWLDAFEEDTLSPNIALGGGFTGAAGTRTFLLVAGTHENIGLLDDDYEVVWGAESRRSTGTMVVDRFGGPAYRITNAGAAISVDDTTWATHREDFNNAGNTSRAFHVLQNIGFAEDWFTGTLGLTLPSVEVRLSDDEPDAAYYVDATNQIHIGRNNWAAWDVVLHEYGHHVAAEHGMGDSPGGAHFIDANALRKRPPAPGTTGNRPGLAADPGTRLAFNEGLAPFLGMMANREGRPGELDPGLPAFDRDTTFHSYASAGATVSATDDLRYAYSMESRTLTRPVDGRPTDRSVRGGGEGSELSVQRILWDFSDATPGETYASGHSDVFSLGARAMWNDLLGQDGGAGTTKPNTLHAFWRNIVAESAGVGNAIYDGTDADGRHHLLAMAGAVFQEYAVSSDPLGPSLLANGDIAFRFTERNDDVSDRFRIALFDEAWNFLSWTNPFADPNHVALSGDAPTVGVDDTMSITWSGVGAGLTAGDRYHWVVLNNSIADPTLTGLYEMYWSGWRTFTYVPGPGSASLALAGVLLAARRGRQTA